MQTLPAVALVVTLMCGPGMAHSGTSAAVPDFATCPVTRSATSVKNEALETFPPEEGRITFKPGGPGFVDQDGALGIKFAWNRLKNGTLQVGGQRLDGQAPPARAYISKGYGESGFQPIYLVFPTPGCWEIFGSVKDAKLAFVVFVEQIGDGPSWRFKGLERGWRLTTGCSGPSDKVPRSGCPRAASGPGR